MSLLAALPSFASELANHLWQSTLIAAAAGLLTLMLKKNGARARFWLWLAASAKFLLPFALLVAAGARLQTSGPAGSPSQTAIVIDELTQPFAASATHISAPAPVSYGQGLMAILPVMLLAIWLLGFITVLVHWYLRWRRMTVALRGLAPSLSGRELELLRRLEPRAGIHRPLQLIMAPSAFEPGIVGIVHPVLLLPAGIADRLSDAQLEAIIRHELCHVRRRDNLAAALHMLVEALFWFHPLVWWMGARLLDERERACDEEVLALGSEPQIYAEGILKICEFYLETPLACAAGVTGSNLKKRIEEIMIHRIARKLETGKKLLLALIAVAAIFGPMMVGLLHPARSQAQTQNSSPAAIHIDSVSIQPTKPISNDAHEGKPKVSSRILFKPDSFTAVNVTLPELIRNAYGVQDSQISGGPAWIKTSFFDAEVKFTSAPGTGHVDRMLELRSVLQAILADHFKLQVHRELKPLPVYELTVGPDGSKMAEAPAGNATPSLLQYTPGHLVGTSVNVATLVQVLQMRVGIPIVDKTGLKGAYDFALTVASGTQPLPEDPAPLLKAVSEQLGLELKPATDTVEVLVIDHAEPVASSHELARSK
jgi:bla regulator protein BlaR1